MANVVKNHSLFPTVVNEFKFDGNKELFESLKDLEVVLTINQTVPRQTKNENLNKLKSFKKLTNKILDTTKEVCKLYEYKYDKLDITNMWLNISNKNIFFPPHTHSNNIFSGVWYPFEDVSKTPIMFLDPRPGSNVMIP